MTTIKGVMSTLMPTADKDTEAPCRFSEDFLQKHTFRDFNSAEQQFWFQPFFYFFFKWKAAQARRGKPYGCWSSASSLDCLIHESSTVSVRFFRHSASSFLTLVLTARLLFQLSPRGFSPLSFAIHILVKCKQLAKISAYNRNQEMFTRPGCSAVRNP